VGGYFTFWAVCGLFGRFVGVKTVEATALGRFVGVLGGLWALNSVGATGLSGRHRFFANCGRFRVSATGFHRQIYRNNSNL